MTTNVHDISTSDIHPSRQAHTVAFETASRLAEIRANEGFTIQPRNPLAPENASVMPSVSFSIPRTGFDLAATAWRTAIASEGLQDHEVSDVRTLRMNPQDGSIGTPRSAGQAYTRHAFAQLWALVGQKHAPYVLSMSTHARAIVFNDVMSTARRAAVVLRLTRHESVISGSRRANNRQIWVVRGVVSKRHSLEYFDDSRLEQALGDYLQKERMEHATMRLTRGTNETHGNIEFTGQHNRGLYRGLSYRNSEVGCVSISFYGSITIRALNDSVIEKDVDEDEVERQSLVIDSGGGSSGRMRHTLPAGSELERSALAKDRMTARMRAATVAAGELMSLWESAFAKNVLPMADTAYQVDDIYLDAIEERIGFADAEEREKFGTQLKDTSYAVNFVRGSVAHIVGVFAMLGLSKRAYEVLRELAK